MAVVATVERVEFTCAECGERLRTGASRSGERYKAGMSGAAPQLRVLTVALAGVAALAAAHTTRAPATPRQLIPSLRPPHRRSNGFQTRATWPGASSAKPFTVNGFERPVVDPRLLRFGKTWSGNGQAESGIGRARGRVLFRCTSRGAG